jgi:hypothetical protein
LFKSYRPIVKKDKQDQQGKAAFNERNTHMTQQQEPMRAPNKNRTGHKTEHGQANHQNDK